MTGATKSSGSLGAVRRAGRGVGAVSLGVLLLPVLLFALVAAPLSMSPAHRAAGWIGRRLAWADGVAHATHPTGGRLLLLLLIHALLAMVTSAVLALVVLGLIVAGQMIVAATTGGPVSIFDAAPGAVTWPIVGGYALPGLLLLFLAVSGLAGIAWLDRRAWTRLSRPGVGELTREVSRLHGTLDDVVAAVDAERRRIERDIHDGVQQRVVALSILLARAERSNHGDEQRSLYERARTETQNILDDLRSVAWRTYPAMLVRDGLPAALDALKERTAIPIRLHADVRRRTDRAVEAAAYFVVSEAITNALKHAHATSIDIHLVDDGSALTLTIRDDGQGGADPDGPGLSGIASRVAARGGSIHIDSPPGGPTTLEAVIPCV